MRLLLARLWLLLPLLLLLQASGAAESAWPTNQQTASYLPGDSSHSHGAPVEDGATVESDGDDASPRGGADAHRSAIHRGVSWSPRLWPAWTNIRLCSSGDALPLRALRLLNSPLRGPPIPRLREPT